MVATFIPTNKYYCQLAWSGGEDCFSSLCCVNNMRVDARAKTKKEIRGDRTLSRTKISMLKTARSSTNEVSPIYKSHLAAYRLRLTLALYQYRPPAPPHPAPRPTLRAVAFVAQKALPLPVPLPVLLSNFPRRFSFSLILVHRGTCRSSAISLNVRPQEGHGKRSSGTDEPMLMGGSGVPSFSALLTARALRSASRSAFDLKRSVCVCVTMLRCQVTT